MSYLARVKKRLSEPVSKASKGSNDTFETCQGRHISASNPVDESEEVYQVLSDLCDLHVIGNVPTDEFKRLFVRVETAFFHGSNEELKRVIAEVSRLSF
ncbi:MAG: hypothetical protein GY847_10320 [Proteobacteria bacterium]|nr:hypothetical protein [Pseudomonadota bacterium]